MKTWSGRRASQREDELIPFIGLLNSYCVGSYLEIGARHGDTFHKVMCALPPGSRGVAVDLAGGAWGTPTSVAALRNAAEDLVRRGYHIDVILGDSTSPRVISAVVALGPFDAVLIDGDHRYNGVKADWLAYRNVANLIAFHDIAGEGQTTKDGTALPVEVPRLWNEIKPGYDHVEIVGSSRGMGIGVIMRCQRA